MSYLGELRTASGSQDNAQSARWSEVHQRRVQTEATRTRPEYALKETELRIQQTAMDEQARNSFASIERKKALLAAKLELARLQSDVAVAEAELQLLQIRSDVSVTEAELQSIHGMDEVRSQRPKPITSVPLDSPINRTRKFVQQHSIPQYPTFQPDNQHTAAKEIYRPGDGYSAPDMAYQPAYYSPAPQQQQIQSGPQPRTTFNPYAETFIPAREQNANRSADVNAAITAELSKFLLKKELLLTRLSCFTDQPEVYAVWKAGFLSITRELNVTPDEEFDLLLKYLGPESCKQARSLRSSNARDPRRGLERVWERLEERYGSPEMVEASLKDRLKKFPKLSNADNKKLYELSDLISEIESVKEDEKYKDILAYFDASSGVRPIMEKLPYSIQEKWISKAWNFKKSYNVPFPPFCFFAQFMRDISVARNDPSFSREYVSSPKETTQLSGRDKRRDYISAKKTDVSDDKTTVKCPMHNTNHRLNQCKAFRAQSIQERKEQIRKYRYCFKCCDSDRHIAKDCKETVVCQLCESKSHPTALHIQLKEPKETAMSTSAPQQGGEKETDTHSMVASKCTEICGNSFHGKSCAKIVLVKVYPRQHPNKFIQTYAVIDDQSNASLAKSELFNLLDVEGDQVPYTLSSCAGTVSACGRKITGLIVQSLDEQTILALPPLIECNNIPNVRGEIPTPNVARNFHHLNDISISIPPLDENAGILLLIGRDLLEAHHVVDQRVGPKKSPFAQKLSLGWVIIGQACLDGVHSQAQVNVSKTFVLRNGRPSTFEPCPNKFSLKEESVWIQNDKSDKLGQTVFETTPHDEKPGKSVEDTAFLNIMDEQFKRNAQGNWEAPLPFRPERNRLPNNRPVALKRAYALDRSLKKDEKKCQHFVEFMQRTFDKGHAEVAPPIPPDQECWFLPIFGVYHPKKKDQIRAVFDAAAQYEGMSLNNVLMSGPDLTNSLLGILLRLRKEPVAITADIEQMFYCFYVTENHRDYLRFFWYQDNNPCKPLIEYRMCVHVLGNCSSPAIASYGLRKVAEIGANTFGEDTRDFVKNDFYVDDGVSSQPSSEEAIDLLNRTRQSLMSGGNIRLHKIASNSVSVMEAFSPADLDKELRDLDLGTDNLPIQRSLGLSWDLETDAFVFKVSSLDKPYTRRGILSTINSLFDPLGFAAPVTIQGKVLLRNLISNTKDWDEPLPTERLDEWEQWKESMRSLETFTIPRTYMPTSHMQVVRKDVHIFCDASEQSISAVAYLKTNNEETRDNWSFILGKAKVSPLHAHTIPRLELCAAVLSVELAEIICEHLDIQLEMVQYHTDSKIVLGYISNDTRRFCVYIANRVGRIRRVSTPAQWMFVTTDTNPADQATRLLKTPLADSSWLLGPSQSPERQDQALVSSEIEPDEVEIDTLSTSVKVTTTLGSARFEKFFSWKRLVRTVANLQHICHSFKGSDCRGWHISAECISVESKRKAEHHIIQVVQEETYNRELGSIESKRPIPRDSPLITLNPTIDAEGLLRVGGRLDKAPINNLQKHPIIIPGRHHIARLLVRNFHEEVHHQGRLLTEGSIRLAGLWITGCKRLVSSIIHQCVQCRKLRGKHLTQKMADLPTGRLEPAPPFSYVGVDTFGPWNIVARKTRGGQANAKRWAVLFTCLVTRAIHLEVVEEMSSSSFINALRRFISIRGHVIEFRSDRGTNFTGATDDLQIDAINVETGPTKDFLFNKGTTWVFNPPHASHMGGVWERMIGTTRRILDAMLQESSAKNLTHEVLTTFMTEAAAIVNSRPIVPVSTDPECPEILTPSTLLTLKVGPPAEPLGNVEEREMYGSQWKRVQVLANTFWKRWRLEYLNTLMTRRKWQVSQDNVKKGDVVILKEKDLKRNHWPTGVVLRPLPGTDNRVRKAEIRIVKDGKPCVFTRPVTDMILLLSS